MPNNLCKDDGLLFCYSLRGEQKMGELISFAGLLIGVGAIGFIVCLASEKLRTALEWLTVFVVGLFWILVANVSYYEGATQAYLFNEKSLDEKKVYEVVGEQHLFSYEGNGDKWLTSLMRDDWTVPRAYGLSKQLEFKRFVVFTNEYGQIEFRERPKGSQSVEKPDGAPTIPESHARRT